jgi:hypothetical protein
LFENVQDGSIVLVGLGYQEETQSHTRIQCHTLKMLLNRLRGIARQQPRPANRDRESRIPTASVPLGDLIEIRLGGVTGQSDFFLLTGLLQSFI